MRLDALLSSKGLNYFYIMHLSYNGYRREELWNFAVDKNIIGLDHRYVKGNWTDVRSKLMGKLTKPWIRQFDILCHEMDERDIVLIINGWDSLLGVVEIVDSEHEYDPKLKGVFFDHIRNVKWIMKYDYDSRKILPYLLEGFNNTLSCVTPNSRRWKILTNLILEI